MKRTIVVNLFSPPNSGKVELANNICGRLLQEGILCKNIIEDKDLVRGARYSGKEQITDEIYIFSKQSNEFFKNHGVAEVMVTNRPLLLSMYYNNKFGRGYYTKLNDLILEQHSHYYNVNLFIDNDFPISDFDISDKLLYEMRIGILDMLNENNVCYEIIKDPEKEFEHIIKNIVLEVEDSRRIFNRK